VQPISVESVQPVSAESVQPVSVESVQPVSVESVQPVNSFLDCFLFVFFLVAPRGYSLITACCTIICWSSLLISMFIWCVMSVHW
jgi:hypothetical protein